MEKESRIKIRRWGRGEERSGKICGIISGIFNLRNVLYQAFVLINSGPSFPLCRKAVGGDTDLTLIMGGTPRDPEPEII
jgi:hypothetical protein